MNVCRTSSIALVLIFASAFAALSVIAMAQNSTRHVSAIQPVAGLGRALSAERSAIPATLAAKALRLSAAPSWQLLATLPGAVIHDLSFISPTTGFAAAEGGQVWKTVNAGTTWTEVLNLGYPYYFYGVDALDANNIVVSGFYDSSTFESLIRWSQDGGTTWSDDIDLSSVEWAQRVRFPNPNNGLIMDLVGDSAGNTVQYTTNGGASAGDWTTVVDNPDGGWFGLEFSILSNLHTRASGINFCGSPNGGATWSCGPSVDSVFDGPTFFLNDTYGWVGGGEISPSVEGWVHVTTNGGTTWSGRTLDGPWPIREILFLTPKIGLAAGGNVYTGVGGIYASTDGGQTWTVDATTNAEMDACASQAVGKGARVWCAGYDESFNGVIYGLEVK